MQELTQQASKIQNQDKRLIVNTMRLANAFYESLATKFKSFDLSAEQFNVLRILIEVCTTAKGLELLEQIDPILAQKEAELLSKLSSSDKEHFANQIEHILNHLNT